MNVLRRVLYFDALGSTAVGVTLVVAPRFVGVTLLDQPELPDYAVGRLFGLSLFTLALLMVLVAHRIEELWWWSWAFVILEAGGAVVTTLHVAFGLPSGAAAWPWWLMSAVSWGFAFALVWGLARAATERPIS